MSYRSQNSVLAVSAVALIFAASLLGPFNTQPMVRSHVSAPPHKPETPAKPITPSTPGNVPLHLVNAVPTRLHLLRPGMSKSEVWETLGLAEYARSISSMGGGSIQDHWACYFLRDIDDFKLIMVFDVSDGKGHFNMSGDGLFKRAELAGRGWNATQLKLGRKTTPPTTSDNSP